MQGEVEGDEPEGHVELEEQREQEEANEDGDGEKKNAWVVDERQRREAKAGNVVVVAKREQEDGVGDEGRDEGRRREDDWHQQELEDVQHEEGREEGVAMYVEGVEPLDALLDEEGARSTRSRCCVSVGTSRRSNDQESVGNEPVESSYDQ